ncbi:MAG: hypothetical protein PHC92_06555 [Syntrophomonadaceae bacterium]|nr:hypothetical protein [Syntrophomonadaceae bacterium]
MSNASRLYKKDNKTIKKSINIEVELYNKLKKLMDNKYDATISELINVAIEDYIDKNSPTFYGKPKNEFVTYRSIMIRKNNINGITKMSDETSISVTRLINGAIKEFIDNDS